MHLELMREREREFPAVDAPEKYLSARIWHCSYRTLDAVRRLTGLRRLEIASYPDRSLEPLSDLTRLQSLRVLHLPKVQTLKPVASLVELRALSLSTLPSWDASRKRIVVESFRPLIQLQSLEHLELLGLTAAVDGLAPLREITSLRTLRVHNDFSVDDFASLRASNPRLEGSYLEPTVATPHNPCSRCGTARVVLSGVPKRGVRCPSCHHARIENHLAEWRAATERAIQQRRREGT